MRHTLARMGGKVCAKGRSIPPQESNMLNCRASIGLLSPYRKTVRDESRGGAGKFYIVKKLPLRCAGDALALEIRNPREAGRSRVPGASGYGGHDFEWLCSRG